MGMTGKHTQTSCFLPMKSRREQAGAANGIRASLSLRPPTLMIDLLFGALMLFAFQMGDPNAKQTIAHDIDLPTTDREAPKTGQKLLGLTPVPGGSSGWRYALPDGRQLEPREIQQMTRSDKTTPVLLVAGESSVENAIAAQAPLRALGIKVGLAVSVVKGKSK